MSEKILLKNIKEYQKSSDISPTVKLARNVSVRGEIIDLAMDWEAFRKIDHSFSEMVSGQMPITNQKSSGRCWGFAGLNLFRIYLGRKYNLKQFEFSQNYFMFFDKLEKSNYFLESIIRCADEPWDSRLVMHLLDDPIQDGGQWHMFVNLIHKYGVVPQTEMPESYQSSKSMRMNRMIARKLREFAKSLRDSHAKGNTIKELRKIKKEMLGSIFQILTISLGSPPASFDWQIRDKDKKFHRFEKLTPKTFFKDHVGLNLTDYVCLINCPMSDKSYNEVYTVDYLGNVIEGDIIRYLNLSSNELKTVAVKSIQDDNPVWFGCDVGKHFHRNLGVMDMDLFDFNLFYGMDFPMTKADRLEYGDSAMTHAMVFTGVDLDGKGRAKKWRVENSWGDKRGDKGYDIMTDSWFDEYNYEVVVHKDYLSKDHYSLYQKDPISLPPWDPMGALAR
ncbi:MAG: C1 family peptidase [Candidatus Marinimicrobia bacterium]|jgi:bleomycin hydrolase|nr:C1 family peptidase [Candidatus Neomarinimicrobiota bacterium]MBT3617397.1 C1 family peptidase [Candidatus Neomarinimicrobiota bacterium]MBT3829337.1 C1 family peptidase [Candidatus Neomarinimicrobiota bacterium]MBT3998295.1 C1 family peptidase [Candidatus Neomarinimicrobiota bacterium]MBT4281596.1 C1 family peptidase [Candidatus Neomarinimicrobiota bacterium]